VSRLLEARDPDGRVTREVAPVQGEEEVRAAVARARAAQRAWGALAAVDRARRLAELGRVLGRRADEIAQRIRMETGKPEAEALAEIVVSADLIRFYRRAAPRRLERRRVGSGWLLGKTATVEREPYGVIGAITPWNYPLVLVMDAVSPALFAGNAIVIKPSEHTTGTAELVPDLCRDAGLPTSLVEVVTGDGTTGAALIRSGVDRIMFTGSTATGRKVMAAAAETLTPVTLELGGKDPALVLEDADLERAARGVVYGAFFNAGQTCISIERAYVVRSVYDRFVSRVRELVEELRVGTGPEADVGPIVTEAQLSVVERHVREALDGGGRALTGGRRLEPGSSVFLPTMLVDVDPSSPVLREESFGPLLPVIPVDDADEAVRHVNALGYGLFASVWTGNRKRGLEIARRLRAGGVSVNDVLSHYAVPGLPMGGVGESGFGRRRGLEALDEMSRTRTLLADRVGLKRELWWFPYSERGSRFIRALLDWRTGRPVRAAKRLLRG